MKMTLAMEDIEMEDLNYYYANYSRFIRHNELQGVSHLSPESITTLSRCERVPVICEPIFSLFGFI